MFRIFSVLFLIAFSLSLCGNALCAVKYKKYRDIYLQRRLAHSMSMSFQDGEQFSKEYIRMEKEMSDMYKRFMKGKKMVDCDDNLKNFIQEQKSVKSFD